MKNNCSWFVLALVLNSVYNCEANNVGCCYDVGCCYNDWKNHLRVYRCLLTNRLHGKAAEICLAYSWNNRVATTK